MSQPRRTPVQERSNDTVQSIFGAASALLTRTPVEEITTSRIAAEAGVSVGALYRFFSDKQVILDAIAVRHMEDFRARMALTLAGSALAAGPAALGKMIDAYVEFLDQRPDFRVLALGRHVSAVTRQAQIRPGAGPAGLLRWFMLKRLGLDDPAQLDLKLEVAIEAGERLIAYAYEQEEPGARARILLEVKKLLAGYLFPAKG
ncbi:MAG: TetR/AcrR family transcriptional regulator [Acidobacteria bacterium]|nr:TetR/AcrR family transcriptional regulator [Acidobacteriota bacterium]